MTQDEKTRVRRTQAKLASILEVGLAGGIPKDTYDALVVAEEDLWKIVETEAAVEFLATLPAETVQAIAGFTQSTLCESARRMTLKGF